MCYTSWFLLSDVTLGRFLSGKQTEYRNIKCYLLFSDIYLPKITKLLYREVMIIKVWLFALILEL